MRTPPTNWTTLMAQPHETETRIDIAGVSYYGYDGNSGIWSCQTRPMLFDKLSVGNCCSSQIDLVLVNPQTIPTMAKMELYVRLVSSLYQWEKRSVITAYFWNKYTVGHRYYWNRYVNIVTHHWKKYSVDVTHADTNLGNTGLKTYSHVLEPETLVLNSAPQIVVIDGEPKYDFSGGRKTVVQADYTPVGSFCAANSDSIKTETGGVGNYHSYYAKVLSIKDNIIFGWVENSQANAEIHGIQTTRSRGTYIEDVSSSNQGSYPQDGEQDGFWYVYDGYTQERGTFIDSVHSNNQAAYPQDGAQGDYWYVYDRSEDCRGDPIGEVSGISGDEYPQDGIQNGYWYVYERSEQQKGELIDTVTSENANAYPQDGAQDGYWYVSTGREATEWVRKGIYYIDTREWDAQHEFLTITGYDAMLKTEQNYFTPPVTITGWPKTDAAVVSEICTRIGVELDARTVLNKGYMVQIPAVSSDGKDSDTLREVLGWIGGMYGGNWCITDEGKLRLVPLVPADTVAVGTDALDLSTTPAYDAIGVVHLVVSEDAEYVAPQSGGTGRAIEISCPWGTQAMANNILTAIVGYVYQPLTVTTATEANPLWELGDAVTVNGYTSVIASIPTSFGLKYTADIEAPESEEINHEYPYQDKGTRTIERKIAQSSASLRVDIDAIIARVQSAEGDISTLNVNVDSIIAQVTDGQGNYTALTLRSDGLHVGNAQGTVTIGSGSIHIPDGAISFGDGTLNGALQAAYNNTGGGDPNPSYIHSTYISQTKVISPHIYGGDLYATGQGNTSGTNPAFYMSDGVTGTGGNTTPNAPKGWLCYDKNGAGTTQEAQNRVFLHSEPGVALKLDAGGDMSIEADDSIYFLSYLKLRKGVNYGTAAQRDAITPENGQIFFVVE